MPQESNRQPKIHIVDLLASMIWAIAPATALEILL